MKTGIRIAWVAASLVAGCGAPTPRPAAPPAAIFLSQPYAAAQPDPKDGLPTFCQVSTDCMALDSRPFSPCLAGSEPCEGKGEFMNVAPMHLVLKPAEIDALLKALPKK
jgi:hypothetical protein